MNALSTIAAAVKTMLAAASPLAGQTFSVVRCFVPPSYETFATNELRVVVVGAEENIDVAGPNTTRFECDHVYGIVVAILKRIAAPDATSPAALAELDGLSDFREALCDLLFNGAPIGDAQLDTLKNVPAYDPATLDQKKTFVSVIAANYRQLR